MTIRVALSVAVIATCFLPGFSYAADAPKNSLPAAAPTSSPFDWSGFYVGVNGGYGMGKQDSNVNCDTTDPTCIISEMSSGFRVNGGLAGITAGLNFATSDSPFLFGIEADADLANITGSTVQTNLDDHGTPSTLDDTLNHNELITRYGSLGSLRARVGVVNGPALMFATGGVAAGSVSDSLNYSNNFGDTNKIESTGVVVGWTLGGGIEYALTDNATIKFEYQHIDLGSRSFATGDYWGNATSTATVGHVLDVAKVGLNWQL